MEASTQQKIGSAKNQLYHFVEKSHGSHSEDLVRAVAWSCIDGGLTACGEAFLLQPVPYSMVAQYIRNECPDMEFMNDFSKHEEDEEDEYAEDEYEEDEYEEDEYEEDEYAEDEDEEDEYEEDSEEQGVSDLWTLTDFLRTKQCQKYCTVFGGAKGTQPYVIADLAALMSRHHLPYAQQLLYKVQPVYGHPNDDAYQARYNVFKRFLTLTVSRPELSAVNSKMKAGKECYIFDILQTNSGIMQQLQAILEDDTVIKVMHDCRQDSAALWYQKGIRIRNIFDTQVADGLVGLWEGMLDGQQHCKQAMSLHSLLTKYQLPQPESKTGVQEMMKNNHQLWKIRPLPQDLINYAIDEVSHLLSLEAKLTAELGKSQLKLLARSSLDYSQWCWLPADRAVPKHACNPSAVASLTRFEPASWLGKLFVISKANNAA